MDFLNKDDLEWMIHDKVSDLLYAKEKEFDDKINFACLKTKIEIALETFDFLYAKYNFSKAAEFLSNFIKNNLEKITIETLIIIFDPESKSFLIHKKDFFINCKYQQNSFKLFEENSHNYFGLLWYRPIRLQHFINNEVCFLVFEIGPAIKLEQIKKLNKNLVIKNSNSIYETLRDLNLGWTKDFKIEIFNKFCKDKNL